MTLISQAKDLLLNAYSALGGNERGTELEAKRKAFIERFPPEALAGLRGRELLRLVHGDRSGEGLLYELEFGSLGEGLGSLLGGSALKFKVYRAQTGEWKTKGPGNYPVTCSEEEAIRTTERLAEQLSWGLTRAEQLGLSSGDRAAWERFDTEVEELPRVLGGDNGDRPTLWLGWVHKYLAVARPDLFSFHHRVPQICSHLVRLGIEPVSRRYLVDWQWRRMRLEDVDLGGCDPILLTQACYDERTFGTGVRYWRMGTVFAAFGHGETLWPQMAAGGFASIGWSELGNLQQLLEGLSGTAAINRLKEGLHGLYQENAIAAGSSASQIYSFFAEMQRGDRIVAMKGQTLQGIGVVEGGYEFHPGETMQHRRPVRWLVHRNEPWPGYPGPLRTVYQFTEKYHHAVHVERLLAAAPDEPPRPVVADPPLPAIPLTGLEARIKEILARKGQVILYGPPGTGKTYHARRSAREIVTRDLYKGKDWAQLNPSEQAQVDRRITFCTFHPAYAYEEFIEGYRPTANGGVGTFELQDGLFLATASAASKEPACTHVLIIDEINRGNVAAVLGELLTLMEADKREALSLRLPLSRRSFTVPRNLWIIGTMNTADRSISLLDAALRRRFGFVELMPEPERLDAAIDNLHLGSLLAALNSRVRANVPRNARELQVGHSYFMRAGRPLSSKAELLEVMRDDVLPLLSEYCFESYSALKEIVGEALVDEAEQVLRSDALSNADRMHAALLALISTDPTALEMTSETSETLEGEIGALEDDPPGDEIDTESSG